MNIYDRPWCRVGPYAVGVFTGYILYKTDCKLTIPKVGMCNIHVFFMTFYGHFE